MGFVLSQQLHSCRLQKKHSPQPIGNGTTTRSPTLTLALVDVRAELFDDAHRLVAEDVAGLHERDEAVDQVQVGAADAGRRDADDGIAAVEDLGVGNVLDLHLVRCTPDEGFHDVFLSGDSS